MKKFFLVFGLTLFLVSCGGNDANDNPDVALGNSTVAFQTTYAYVQEALASLEHDSYSVSEAIDSIDIDCSSGGTATLNVDGFYPSSFELNKCKTELDDVEILCSLAETPEVTIDGTLTFDFTEEATSFGGSLVLTGNLDFTCEVDISAPRSEGGAPELDTMTGTVCGIDFEDILEIVDELELEERTAGVQKTLDEFCASLE